MKHVGVMEAEIWKLGASAGRLHMPGRVFGLNFLGSLEEKRCNQHSTFR